MQDFQKRVIYEKADLDVKVISLRDFLKTGQTAVLSNEEKELLGKQLVAMEDYQKVLAARIKLF